MDFHGISHFQTEKAARATWEPGRKQAGSGKAIARSQEGVVAAGVRKGKVRLKSYSQRGAKSHKALRTYAETIPKLPNIYHDKSTAVALHASQHSETRIAYRSFCGP